MEEGGHAGRPAGGDGNKPPSLSLSAVRSARESEEETRMWVCRCGGHREAPKSCTLHPFPQHYLEPERWMQDQEAIFSGNILPLLLFLLICSSL
jgi:hypothetical protein